MNVSEIHQQSIDVENDIVYLNGDSLIKDEEPGVDYRMASTFIKNMQIMKAKRAQVTIHMNTVGGCWNYGMAIYDAIRWYPYHTTVVAHSWARSMSSIILQAADDRILMPHCDFMVHLGTATYDGHYLTAQSAASHDKLSEAEMLKVYAKRIVKCETKEVFVGTPQADIESYIHGKMKEHGDWWLTAFDAVRFGFADKVFGQ